MNKTILWHNCYSIDKFNNVSLNQEKSSLILKVHIYIHFYKFNEPLLGNVM